MQKTPKCQNTLPSNLTQRSTKRPFEAQEKISSPLEIGGDLLKNENTLKSS
jgi:hypothetical protein